MNGTPPSTNIFSNAGTATLLDGHALYMQLSAKTPASCRHCLLHRQSPDVPAVKCFGNLPIGFISFAVIKKPCTLLCRADDSIWGYFPLRQHCTIPALRLKHRSGSCGTASALPKCSIMSGCGTRIVLRGQKPLALCDRCPCFGSLFPPLAALTFAASSIICAFGLAAAAPRSPYRHLELCGIAFTFFRAYFAPAGRPTLH